MSSDESTNEALTSTNSDEGGASSDVLVVVSKVKKFVKEASGFSTSKEVADILSAKVIKELNRGIENARNAGRKTVMARDLEQ